VFGILPDMGTQSPFDAARLAIHVENPAALEKALASADVNARESDSRRTLLHIAATSSDTPELIRILVSHGAALDAVDAVGHTPLYAAVNAKYPKVTQALLEAGANADFVFAKDRTTPLFRATYINRPDIALLLLPHTRNLDVEARDDGGTALLWAAGLDSTELVQQLVQRGADVRAPGILQSAAFNGRVRHIEYLMSQGVDINSRNRYGATALHVASGRGLVDMVTWLLGHGANPSLKDAQDLLPIDWARQRNQDAVASLLADGSRPGTPQSR